MKNDAQHKTAMAMSTAMQWQCQQQCQATATQVVFSKKAIMLNHIFCIFNCYQFFPFLEVFSVFTPARLFLVG